MDRPNEFEFIPDIDDPTQGTFSIECYCTKHGEIGTARLGFTVVSPEATREEHGPWCMYCIAEMLDKFCCRAELVEEDECSI